ncbi:MAG: hypothetical protein ACTJLM_05105 [Ehrlichia sp.]
MKNYIYVAIYFVVVAFSYEAMATPVYVKGGYNFGVSYSDSFRSEYVDYKQVNVDLATAIGYVIQSGFFYEFEVRYANIKTAIQKLSDFEKIDLINIFQRILDEKVYVSKIESMLEINSVTALINCGYNYVINNKLVGYLSYGVGVGGVLNYQGFRNSAASHYGISMQSEIGLCYLYNGKASLCAGYNYLKNYWKYDTNKIYDEEGNTVMYHFQKFSVKFSCNICWLEIFALIILYIFYKLCVIII